MLKDRYPAIAKEWDSDKNGDVNNVTHGSNKVVWWKCKRGHELELKICKRVALKRGCKVCYDLDRMNKYSISNNYPIIAKEWDYDKNNKNITPKNTSYKSTKRFYWKCNKGHKYHMGIRSRIKYKMCPICIKNNSLHNTNPKNKLPLTVTHEHIIIEYWNYDKNVLDPTKVSHGSNRVAWWKCDKDHEFDMTIKNFVRRVNCPICSGRRVTKKT